jgi:DNA repair protein SbcC/Rad50
MRPVRLTMQAFGPFAGQEVVDFREAVESGLFGIYGATGAGKSSIFNAMTFALFGEATKAGQDRTSLRSDHADVATPTEVEFVFDLAGRRYVVVRRPDQKRPKLRGEGYVDDPHTAHLFDATGIALEEIADGNRGKIVAEKKVGTVNEAVTGLLGYGADQFRKIVLLPQGQFEAFLSANTGERIEILRDLFDVSIYRSLTQKLKEEAELVIAEIKERRSVCERQLEVESVDGLEALVAVIVDAEAQARVQAGQVESSQETQTAAHQAWTDGKSLADKFAVAEKARSAHAELESKKPTIEALRSKADRAERAKSLLPSEGAVTKAEGEIRAAETRVASAVRLAAEWENKATEAQAKFEAELGRAGEVESHRTAITKLETYKATVEGAAAMAEAAKVAVGAEKTAAKALADAETALKEKIAVRDLKSAALKSERDRQGQRLSLRAALETLTAQHKAALAWEKAEKAVGAAKRKVKSLVGTRHAASEAATNAKEQFEKAERALAAEQALHLAATLKSGEPCPVCGSAEHPAPASGLPRHADLEHAFRVAKATWEKADAASRAEETDLAAARGVFEEAERQFGNLEPPADKSAGLSSKLEATKTEVQGLGPGVDLPGLEAALAVLVSEIGALETDRDRLRDEHGRLKIAAATATTTLEATLASVPAELRTAAAIQNNLDRSRALLAEREQAKTDAEMAEREAREKSLSATKDTEAARDVLKGSQDRRDMAHSEFDTQLAAEGLTKEEFQDLKLAIPHIEADRKRVEAFGYQQAVAADTARKTMDEIAGLTTPDIAALEEAHLQAKSTHALAMTQRAAADQRVISLTSLHNQIEGEVKALAEKETATGPLRNLAQLLKGDNSQKIDLETFAIGAMFDRVLSAGNLRLGPMSNYRYRMERDAEGSGRGRRGLGIQIFDLHTGKPRSTSTLSGGEGFFVALALALGLADVVESNSGKVRLDSIFVDEGFGSLDAENGAGTLDQVLGVLSSLVSANRAVGLISHVKLVQDAVPNGFYVHKTPSGSHVEARGA